MEAAPIEAAPVDPARIYAIERPDPALLTLYIVRSIVFTAVAGFLFAFIPLYFRYSTLRYRFDEHGVAITYGILFRTDTFLTYEKIQDIHLTRTWLERVLGIGTVEVQTASSTAGAVESLVGLRDHELVRDFLYQRMRGHEPAKTAGDPLEVLAAIRDELRGFRSDLAGPAPAPPSPEARP